MFGFDLKLHELVLSRVQSTFIYHEKLLRVRFSLKAHMNIWYLKVQ